MSRAPGALPGLCRVDLELRLSWPSRRPNSRWPRDLRRTFNPTLSTLYYGGPSISVGGIYVDPSTYSISNGLVTFGSAPASGSIAWSGSFGFLCRFAQDDIDFEEFMQNLWSAKSVKFRSVRAQ